MSHSTSLLLLTKSLTNLPREPLSLYFDMVNQDWFYSHQKNPLVIRTYEKNACIREELFFVPWIPEDQ